jgi:CBS domain containing-hemolysin-like protein
MNDSDSQRAANQAARKAALNRLDAWGIGGMLLGSLGTPVVALCIWGLKLGIVWFWIGFGVGGFLGVLLGFVVGARMHHEAIPIYRAAASAPGPLLTGLVMASLFAWEFRPGAWLASAVLTVIFAAFQLLLRSCVKSR